MHASERHASTARTRAAVVAGAMLIALLAGCSSWGFPGVYRINVEQGNIVTVEMLEQLEKGMNRRQVRYILGTPLVEDPFNDDRWEYLYMVRNGETTLIDQRLTVYFQGDILTRWESNQPLPGEEDGAANGGGENEDGAGEDSENAAESGEAEPATAQPAAPQPATT